jgi:hypothetical protein
MEDERISSIDSTVTSVRSEFLRGDTLPQLYKLLARAEYGLAVKDIAPERIKAALTQLRSENSIPSHVYREKE